MILIEHNGEQMLVSSVKGYDGCTVLHENVPPPPSEFHRNVNGKWVEDVPAKQAAKENERLMGLSRVELLREAAKQAREVAREELKS